MDTRVSRMMPLASKGSSPRAISNPSTNCLWGSLAAWEDKGQHKKPIMITRPVKYLFMHPPFVLLIQWIIYTIFLNLFNIKILSSHQPVSGKYL
jgi:hypothetical protein